MPRDPVRAVVAWQDVAETGCRAHGGDETCRQIKSLRSGEGWEGAEQTHQRK